MEGLLSTGPTPSSFIFYNFLIILVGIKEWPGLVEVRYQLSHPANQKPVGTATLTGRVELHFDNNQLSENTACTQGWKHLDNLKSPHCRFIWKSSEPI